MFYLTITTDFAAAHYLPGYPGNCARIHGHTWKAEVTVAARETDRQGMVIDFRALKAILQQVVAGYDHALLNEISPFDRINPTAEMLAYTIYREMAGRLPEGVAMHRVKVWESSSAAATYCEEGNAE